MLKKILKSSKISVARNSTINVEDVSRYGGRGVLDDLDTSMQNYNPEWIVGKNETSDKLPPQQILQVTRLFTSDDLQQMYKSQENIVKSYRNKAIVLKDFADMYETNKEMKKADASAQYELYNFDHNCTNCLE